MTKPAGVILAGGRGMRMGGRDKALLPLGGIALAERARQRLTPQVAALAINTNSALPHANLGLPVVADTLPGHQGPLAGILAAMLWAQSQTGCDRLVTVSCDTPFFPADLAARLDAARSEQTPIALAASLGHTHPVFGLWSLDLMDTLRHHLETSENRSVMHFAEKIGWTGVAFQPMVMHGRTVDPFFNINTPAELAEAEDYLAGS